MIKKYIYGVLGLIALAQMLSSCEAFLDKPPLDRIGNDSYWKTASDLENYTLQYYPVFSFFRIDGYQGIMGVDALRGSDTQIASGVNTTMNGSRNPVTSGGNWGWDQIRSVNFFLDNYRKCQDPVSAYGHFLGEAHFFKAWFYFEKLKSYGDVPWFAHALEMQSDELYQERNSRVVVVDSILWNIDQAIRFLNPLQSVIGGKNRLSKETALLFKTRVALYEGSWQKYHRNTDFGTAGVDPNKYFRICVNAAEELMAPANGYRTGLYSTSNPEDDWCKMFSLIDQTNNPEVFLWMRFNVGMGLTNRYQMYISERTTGQSITFEQIQHYLDRDGNPYDYYAVGQTVKGNQFITQIAEECDPRLSQLIWIPGMLMWDNFLGYNVFDKPYIDQSGLSLNSTGFQLRKGSDPKVNETNSMETSQIVFRYAEVLLNYAEAKCELEETVDYNKSINLLRQRSGMPDFKIQTDPTRLRYADYGYQISDELYEIRRERTVELACESFRYDDIMRWAAHKLIQGKRPKGYPLDLTEWQGTTINYSVDTNGFLDPFSTQLPNGYGFKPDRDYLECIPLNEITLNPKLKQNPGWSQ